MSTTHRIPMKTFRHTSFALLLALTSFGASLRAAENWPQFRGPRSDGLSESKALPSEWGAEKNIA